MPKDYWKRSIALGKSTIRTALSPTHAVPGRPCRSDTSRYCCAARPASRNQLPSEHSLVSSTPNGAGAQLSSASNRGTDRRDLIGWPFDEGLVDVRGSVGNGITV